VPAPPAGAEALSFGAWLRRSRALRELTVEEVVEATRLPPRLVQALESDDVRSFPDRAYALHAVRACAEAIGLDPHDAALRFEEWLGTQPADTLPPPVRNARAKSFWRRLRGVPAASWAVLLVTVVACALLLLRR
jgi:cytoskeletal protein RodZ